MKIRSVTMIVSIIIMVFMMVTNIALSYQGGIYEPKEPPFYRGFEIRIKGWASQLTGTTSFNPNASYSTTRGTSFSFPNTFDLKNVYGFGGTRTSIQIEARKEINENSFANICYFADTRESRVNLTSDVAFVWNQKSQPSDTTPGITYLPQGTELSTTIKINTFEIGYGYYIGKKYQKGYLAALVGLRFNNIAIDWGYRGQSISGVDRYRRRGASGFIGIDGRYMFSDNVSGYIKINGGVVGGAGNRIGQFEYEIGTTIKITEQLSAEIGYKYADIKAREEIGSKIAIKLQGINGGLVFKF
ncbi:MAG: hypothetical protein ABDH21_01220 [bacterium]